MYLKDLLRNYLRAFRGSFEASLIGISIVPFNGLFTCILRVYIRPVYEFLWDSFIGAV